MHIYINMLSSRNRMTIVARHFASMVYSPLTSYHDCRTGRALLYKNNVLCNVVWIFL